MGSHGVAITFNLLLFFSFLYGSVESLRSEEEVKWLFEEWKLKHDRSYHDLVERDKRFDIFRSNLLFIDEHNRPENNHSFTLGLNHFADLSNEEYRSLYVPSPLNMSDALSTDGIVEPPPKSQLRQRDSWDWRDHGVVSGVKNQRACQCCWAFTAVATVESLNAQVTGDLITLSEQELVDCDMLNSHCLPGYTHKAYEYIVRNGGIDTDTNYPYRARQRACKANRDHVVTIDGYRQGPRNQEAALKAAVRRQPVASAVDASSREFQLYDTGVFDDFCTTQVNHAVTIVGYGEEGGLDFWLIKNSYGINWGDQGYIKLRRNIRDRKGKCGIAMWTYYPRKRAAPKSNISLSIEK